METLIAQGIFSILYTFFKEILVFGEVEAKDIELDRAHRMGRKRNKAVRRKVVQVHRYSECEKVRIRG